VYLARWGGYLGAVDSATTYEPYGRLLVRSGASGTVYGFTGEQHDGTTGLVYLRARYYNPALRVFMSPDPFPGCQLSDRVAQLVFTHEGSCAICVK
jgi:RHS repeat-associated protein